MLGKRKDSRHGTSEGCPRPGTGALPGLRSRPQDGYSSTPCLRQRGLRRRPGPAPQLGPVSGEPQHRALREGDRAGREPLCLPGKPCSLPRRFPVAALSCHKPQSCPAMPRAAVPNLLATACSSQHLWLPGAAGAPCARSVPRHSQLPALTSPSHRPSETTRTLPAAPAGCLPLRAGVLPLRGPGVVVHVIHSPVVLSLL